jgi:deoxycytidine triphosphate deaminase
MAVIPLVLKKTVVTTEQAFEDAQGRQGSALLIRNFDDEQLKDNAPNLSYDLRVGGEYKDHRDGWKRDILADDPKNDRVDLLPGSAVIIETEENLHVPKGMFGYLVPRVEWLQKGISNTSSKVDAGYNGRLLVTLFNLGRRKVTLHRRERFCSLVIHSVGPDVVLYDKDAKKISGVGHKRWWQEIRDEIEANRTIVELVLILATILLAIADVRLHSAMNALRNSLGQQ